MNPILIIIFASVLAPVEWLLSYNWNKSYFGSGIPIFKKNFKARKLPNAEIEAKDLERVFRRGFRASTLFRATNESRILFRDEFELFGPYSPHYKILHGNIEISQEDKCIKITGYLNWVNPVAAIIVVYLIFFTPQTEVKIYLGLLLPIWAINVWLQYEAINKLFQTLQLRYKIK
jgi:hypothetical protein